MPICLALDGESFILNNAKKLRFALYKKAPYLRIIRGPEARFKTGL